MPSKKPEEKEVTTDTLVIDKDVTPLLADDDDDFWDGGERCGDGCDDDEDEDEDEEDEDELIILENELSDIEDLMQAVHSRLTELFEEFQSFEKDIQGMQAKIDALPSPKPMADIVKSVLRALKKKKAKPPRKKKKQPPGRPVRTATKTKLPPKQTRVRRAVKKATPVKAAPVKATKKVSKKAK